jgi:hypothetical protein
VTVLYKYVINRLASISRNEASEQISFGEYLFRIGEGRENGFKIYDQGMIKLPDELCLKEFNRSGLIDNDFTNFTTDTKMFINFFLIIRYFSLKFSRIKKKTIINRVIFRV